MDEGEETARLIERLAAIPARLAAVFGQLQEADAVVHAPPGEWSPAEVLGHLRATHDITAPRILAILARDNPPLTAFDDLRWRDAARYVSLPPLDSLESLRLRRQELVFALRGLSPAAWARSGRHETRGPVTVLEIAQDLAAHDEEHCAQLEAMIAG